LGSYEHYTHSWPNSEYLYLATIVKVLRKLPLYWYLGFVPMKCLVQSMGVKGVRLITFLSDTVYLDQKKTAKNKIV